MARFLQARFGVKSPLDDERTYTYARKKKKKELLVYAEEERPIDTKSSSNLETG